MPTNRRRVDRDRVDQLNPTQESVLRTGSECISGWPGFVDDEHARAAWRAHREQLMAEYDRPGCRPHAFWLYDMGLEEARDRWDELTFAWPAPHETQEQMVYAMLKCGDLQPLACGITRELSAIRELWAHSLTHDKMHRAPAWFAAERR
jgi:hypothetical protein